MGKQLWFYMTAQDEEEFMEYARSTGDVVILPQVSKLGVRDTFTTFRAFDGHELGGGCYLWNRSISPEPEYRYIQQQGYFSLNVMRSEVVSVWRSKQTRASLSMGRLHIDDEAFSNKNEVAKKNQEFVRWYNQLCKWIQKNYPETLDGARLSPSAASLAKSGIELIGLCF